MKKGAVVFRQLPFVVSGNGSSGLSAAAGARLGRWSVKNGIVGLIAQFVIDKDHLETARCHGE